MHDIKHKLKEKRMNETRLLFYMYDLIIRKLIHEIHWLKIIKSPQN